MSFSFGADPSTIIAAISGILQATQTWYAHRDARRAAQAIDSAMQAGTNTPALAQATNQLISLAPPAVISAIGDRVEVCWTRYSEILKAPPGSYMPHEIDAATEGVGACVCRELKRLVQVNGSIPPGKLADWWQHFRCN